MIEYEELQYRLKRTRRDTFPKIRQDCLTFLNEEHPENEKQIIEFLAGEIFYMSGYVDFGSSWKDE